MHFLKTFTSFNESMDLEIESILLNMDSETIDPKTIFNYKLTNKSLEKISDDIDFINALTSKGLKKTDIKSSDDYETFIKTPFKYLFISDINSTELDNPLYIIIQKWDKHLLLWTKPLIYTIKSDINNLYDRMTLRMIELTDKTGEKWIYSTSNGNEWVLQNKEPNKTFLKVFRDSDFRFFVKNNQNIKKV